MSRRTSRRSPLASVVRTTDSGGGRKDLRRNHEPPRRRRVVDQGELRRDREYEGERRERRVGIREGSEAEAETPDERKRDHAHIRRAMQRFMRQPRSPREREESEENTDRRAVHAKRVQVV